MPYGAYFNFRFVVNKSWILWVMFNIEMKCPSYRFFLRISTCTICRPMHHKSMYTYWKTTLISISVIYLFFYFLFFCISILRIDNVTGSTQKRSKVLSSCSPNNPVVIFRLPTVVTQNRLSIEGRSNHSRFLYSRFSFYWILFNASNKVMFDFFSG